MVETLFASTVGSVFD